MIALTLTVLLAVEIFFLVRMISTKNNPSEEKAIIRIALPILFGLLVLAGIYEWSFRLMALAILLSFQAVVALISLIRNKPKSYKPVRGILQFTRNCLLLVFALMPAFIFPSFTQIEASGDHEISTAKYTWTDDKRIESYDDSGKNRTLTVDFWYPADPDGSYPLILFSHGAFGFSGSNLSTFADLASNGYVVASISHTHQAFFTADTHGQVSIVDPGFLQEAVDINASHDVNRAEKIYNTTKEWMKLRTDDQNFVLDMILDASAVSTADEPFSMIDVKRIGCMGHSLGGASAAQLGRERNDIDAVIVLDGTMLGEEIAFADGKPVLVETPYPVPLLNVYAEDHYKNSMELDGEGYNNFHATKLALDAYETVFKDAGHLNFTDLPLFSPRIAATLGVGSIDARRCIEDMNHLVLNFFDSYLKDKGAAVVQPEY